MMVAGVQAPPLPPAEVLASTNKCVAQSGARGLSPHNNGLNGAHEIVDRSGSQPARARIRAIAACQRAAQSVATSNFCYGIFRYARIL
jgi:hypothetical protein